MEKHWKCKLDIAFQSRDIPLKDTIITKLNSDCEAFRISKEGYSCFTEDPNIVKMIKTLLPIFVPLSQDMETMEEMNKALAQGVEWEWWDEESQRWRICGVGKGYKFTEADMPELQNWRRVKTTYKYYRPCEAIEEAQHLMGVTIEYEWHNRYALCKIEKLFYDRAGDLVIASITTAKDLLKRTVDYTPIGVECTREYYEDNKESCVKVAIK